MSKSKLQSKSQQQEVVLSSDNESFYSSEDEKVPKPIKKKEKDNAAVKNEIEHQKLVSEVAKALMEGEEEFQEPQERSRRRSEFQEPEERSRRRSGKKRRGSKRRSRSRRSRRRRR